MSLFVALSAAALPCILIWIRLMAARQKGSYEGEALVSTLLRQYRISNFNIAEAIEMLLGGQTDLKVTRKLLFALLIKLRAAGDPGKIRMACEEFAFALGTNWARMLAHNISEAASKGTNVSLALEDVQIQLREARAAAEERKRLNGEALRMTTLLVPILYLATAVMAVWYLELPLARFWENQFETREGLVFFLLISFFFAADMGFLTLIVKQKYDY